MAPPRKTHAAYVAECVSGGRDLPIDQYTTARVRIRHLCGLCLKPYKQRPANHLNGNGCSDCRGGKRKTDQQYRQECIDKNMDPPLDSDDNRYVNAYSKLIHFCRKEDHPYYQRPGDHLTGYGCSRCNHGVLKTDAEYREDCVKNNVSLPIDNEDNRYVNDEVKLLFPCLGGHVYKQQPSKHLAGKGCIKCNGGAAKTDAEYRQECEARNIDLHIDSPDNRYINNYSKLTHRCQKGHPYDQAPSNHLRGRGCPICRYKTAALLLDFLLELGLEVAPEKIFSWAPTRRFDFYIPSLNLIIELDGPHHFGETGYSSMEHSQQLAIDVEKKMFPAVERGFHFMRILQPDFLDDSTVMKDLVTRALDWHATLTTSVSFIAHDPATIYQQHDEAMEYCFRSSFPQHAEEITLSRSYRPRLDVLSQCHTYCTLVGHCLEPNRFESH